MRLTPAGVLLSALYLGIIGLNVLRFSSMYRLGSRLQSWRRYDPLRLIPIGAFFSPGAPPTEFGLTIRGCSAHGVVSPWTALPRSVSRRWWHVVWNPGKIDYRLITDVCRGLLSAATAAVADGTRSAGSVRWDAAASPLLQLSDEYIAVLRLAATEAGRLHPDTVAVQFAVTTRDLEAQAPVEATLVSAAHRIAVSPA